MEDIFKAYQVAYGKAKTGKNSFTDDDYGEQQGIDGYRDFSEEERTAVNLAIDDAKGGKKTKGKKEVLTEVKLLLGKS